MQTIVSDDRNKSLEILIVAAIIISALVPVVSALADGSTVMKVLIGGCGSAVTVINAYLSVENSKDLWYSNRQSRETLLSTHYYT